MICAGAKMTLKFQGYRCLIFSTIEKSTYNYLCRCLRLPTVNLGWLGGGSQVRSLQLRGWSPNWKIKSGTETTSDISRHLEISGRGIRYTHSDNMPSAMGRDHKNFTSITYIITNSRWTQYNNTIRCCIVKCIISSATDGVDSVNRFHDIRNSDITLVCCGFVSPSELWMYPYNYSMSLTNEAWNGHWAFHWGCFP